jgi:ASCH domain
MAYDLYKETLTKGRRLPVAGQEAPIYALSIKQPWAALVVLRLKTIEIRRWPTARRGRVLIHAARVPDNRPEGWQKVPAEGRELAQLQGGVIGSAELVECIPYRDLPAFQIHQPLHRNELSWFEPPVLYGFRFTGPEAVPFRAYPGWFRFFKIAGPAPLPAEGALATR